MSLNDSRSNGPFWPADLVELLEHLVEMGLSGSQAAPIVGKSRSAVVAKAWRIGLSFRAQPKPDVWRVYRRRARV